jgi:hypothetical protein
MLWCTAGRNHQVALPRSSRGHPRRTAPGPASTGPDPCVAGPGRLDPPGTGGRPIRHGDSHRSRHLGTVAAAALGSAGVLAYAWWATGVRSFTAGASIAVAVPVVIVATVALGDLLSRPPGNPAAVSTQAAREADQGRGRRHRHDAAPWLVLLLVTLILEGTALVLGGRSADVPTLSTVVDHGLRWHWLRLVLFCGWLCIGALPLVRARLRKQRAV